MQNIDSPHYHSGRLLGEQPTELAIRQDQEFLLGLNQGEIIDLRVAAIDFAGRKIVARSLSGVVFHAGHDLAVLGHRRELVLPRRALPSQRYRPSPEPHSKLYTQPFLDMWLDSLLQRRRICHRIHPVHGELYKRAGAKHGRLVF